MTPNKEKIRGETRRIGKPAHWDETLDGSCGMLSVRDEIDVQSGVNFMHSEWTLQAGELKLLQNYNGVVVIGISGVGHPIVSMRVEARPGTEDNPLDNVVSIGEVATKVAQRVEDQQYVWNLLSAIAKDAKSRGARVIVMENGFAVMQGTRSEIIPFCARDELAASFDAAFDRVTGVVR